jgi:hypothetical protein
MPEEIAGTTAEPVATTPPANEPATTEPAQDNATNAAQRLLKKAEKERDDARAELQQRRDAEMSETERLKKERDDARKEADSARLEALRTKAGTGLPEEAMEFLTGNDAETLAAQADKLRGLYGNKPAEAPAPVQAGTTTRPGTTPVPSVQERLAAAQKSGNVLEQIRIMRSDQFKDK